MSRPLRIEYPDAWYHVMNRGRRREKIFSGIKDYTLFIGLLKESCYMWHVRIGAFCLMPNHYHILIQTPEGNISRCMRHINGVYTQRFNRIHGCDGPLFRGRYKSILVEAETYLLELLRYIHRNPLKAGLAESLGKSYGGCAYGGSQPSLRSVHPVARKTAAQARSGGNCTQCHAFFQSITGSTRSGPDRILCPCRRRHGAITELSCEIVLDSGNESTMCRGARFSA